MSYFNVTNQLQYKRDTGKKHTNSNVYNLNSFAANTSIKASAVTMINDKNAASIQKQNECLCERTE